MSDEKRLDRVKRVAELFVKQLENNTSIYTQPWDASKPDASRPINGITGKPYRGINSLILASQGWEDPRCFTFPQIKSVDAHLRRDQHGTTLEFWVDEKKVKNKETGRIETIKLDHGYPVPFTVFNASQIEGLEPFKPRVIDWVPIERAQALVDASGAWIEHREGNAAFYSPASDRIILPLVEQFKNAEFLAATSLHELSHWTAHPSRLNRDLSGTFASESYAREELRAEIGSFLLCADLGVSRPGLDDQHAAYVNSWIRALKNDPMEIFRAAADSQKIATFLMQFDRQHMLEQEQGQQQEQQRPTAKAPEEQPAPAPARAPGAARQARMPQREAGMSR